MPQKADYQQLTETLTSAEAARLQPAGPARGCGEERAAPCAGPGSAFSLWPISHQPVSAVPLGKNADFDAAVANQKDTNVSARSPSLLTVKAWYLRSVGRELLQKSGYGFRLRSCGAKISKRERGVSIYRRPDRPYGRVSGVCVCAQSVVCPVCAPRIAAFRAAEVEEAFVRARRAGFEAWLDTYTMPHWAGSSLGSEIDTFGRAWRQFSTNRSSRKVALGYLGNHTAREITWSERNGWHYHHHQLRYHRPGTHEDSLLRASWLAQLHAVGRRTAGAEEHAFFSELVRDEKGASYTAKLASCVDAQARAVGLEVAASANKGRNIVRLLGDFARGDDSAGQAWLHGVREVCTRKVSSVRWSPRLREKLGIEAPEKSDEEIAQEKAERTDELLGELTALQWRAVLLHRGEFALVAAAQHGVDAINTFLSGIDAGEIHTAGLPEPRRDIKGPKPCHTIASRP